MAEYDGTDKPKLQQPWQIPKEPKQLRQKPSVKSAGNQSVFAFIINCRSELIRSIPTSFNMRSYTANYSYGEHIYAVWTENSSNIVIYIQSY